MSNYERIASANAAIGPALTRFAKAIDRPVLACKLALIAYPLGAVRLYLPAAPVPRGIDAELCKAVRAALEL